MLMSPCMHTWRRDRKDLKESFQFSGKVKRSSGRGKKLGFPTANLDVEVSGEVEEGIYVGFTEITPSSSPLNKRENDGEGLPSLIFIGAAETFGETEKRLEVYILDFSNNLYGQTMTVELIKKIRENRKFATLGELVEQMKKDELEARDFFKQTSPNL